MEDMICVGTTSYGDLNRQSLIVPLLFRERYHSGAGGMWKTQLPTLVSEGKWDTIQYVSSPHPSQSPKLRGCVCAERANQQRVMQVVCILRYLAQKRCGHDWKDAIFDRIIAVLHSDPRRTTWLTATDRDHIGLRLRPRPSFYVG